MYIVLSVKNRSLFFTTSVFEKARDLGEMIDIGLGQLALPSLMHMLARGKIQRSREEKERRIGVWSVISSRHGDCTLTSTTP